MKKKQYFIILIGIILFITSCGPNEAEIKAREKAIADSLKIEYDEKFEAEEKARKEAEYNSSPDVIRKKKWQKEADNPKKYLTIEYETDYNVWSSSDMLEGFIYNSAELATFKDIKLVISCFSKTDRLIESFDYILDDWVEPYKSVNFKIKYKSPSGTKTVGVDIKTADATDNY
jgi:hypothetical protein